ncbi:dTDP-4-dehydrorhamnose 3,5-epimerase family protein [Streptomyces sp. NPDC091376]|uniref:dTDP-4-dehydrorhamnose 3,5-epimerase family protein n=1 Tax=Streptomyces sp. NPDC091376 TaxID=3365994 RepID=UPI00380A2CC8
MAQRPPRGAVCYHSLSRLRECSVRQLSIAGAWLLEPTLHRDSRGSFHEWFRACELTEATGAPFPLAQANCSVSHQGVLRGIHYADVPPGQTKYITCVYGAILDVVVDLRTGSPTFGRWEAVRLDDRRRQALHLSVGLGHSFLALAENTTVVYLTSSEYTPHREHAIHPFDPTLGIDWPAGIAPVLSDKDAAAPSLEQVQRAGKLPSYHACLAVMGLPAGPPRARPEQNQAVCRPAPRRSQPGCSAPGE